MFSHLCVYIVYMLSPKSKQILGNKAVRDILTKDLAEAAKINVAGLVGQYSSNVSATLAETIEEEKLKGKSEEVSENKEPTQPYEAPESNRKGEEEGETTSLPFPIGNIFSCPSMPN